MVEKVKSMKEGTPGHFMADKIFFITSHHFLNCQLCMSFFALDLSKYPLLCALLIALGATPPSLSVSAAVMSCFYSDSTVMFLHCS